jgi:FMN phosphatase YigB (HAD superfamily)
LMIEDLPANLKPAKEMGMTTVLVREDISAADPERDGFVDYRIPDILKLPGVLKKLKRI